MTELIRMRTTRRNDIIENENNTETEMTEEVSVRENTDADTSESVCDSGFEAVKVEMRSEVEVHDGVRNSEIDLPQEIPVQSTLEDDVEEEEIVSEHNAFEDSGANASGEISDDTVAALSEGVEVHSSDGCREVPDTVAVAEVANSLFDDDGNELVDASSEMPDVQIDTNSILPSETATNLEDILPDVPDFQIEIPEIEPASGANVPGKHATENSRDSRMTDNKVIDPPGEISNADVEEEEIGILPGITDINRTTPGTETPENRETLLGDIVMSALGGILEISPPNSGSDGSNETPEIIIEDIQRNNKDENEERCQDHCRKLCGMVSQSAARIFTFLQEKIPLLTSAFSMTILQAWTVSAFITCVIPCYVAYNRDKQRYKLKSWIPQMIVCCILHGFAIAEGISQIHLVSKIFTGELSPFTFIQVGAVFATIASTLWFSKICLFDIKKILDYENLIELENDQGQSFSQSVNGQSPPGSNKKKMSFKNAMLFMLNSFVFIGLLIGSDTGSKLEDFDPDWKQGGPAVALQMFACHSRQVYQWKNESTCGLDWLAEKISELPTEEIMHGILGIMSYWSSRIAEYQRHVIINTCNMAFFMDTWMAESAVHETNKPVFAIYHHLKERTAKLSSFSGVMLLIQLVDVACRLPMLSVLFLKGNMLQQVQLLTLLIAFFGYISLGCTGTWMANLIRDQMSQPRGHSSLPATVRETAVLFVQLYDNAVGLGISGLVVINFAFMAAYANTAGGFVMMLYEIENNDCN